MALRKMGKKVVTVDLNPMSRTAIWSNITIVNHVRRALQEMVELAQKLQNEPKENLIQLIDKYDNNEMLQDSVQFMADRLVAIANEKLQEEL